ncbi:MAG: hypothetical protein R2827_04020 [Bdellovibrionales bacterium]
MLDKIKQGVNSDFTLLSGDDGSCYEFFLKVGIG